MLAPTSPAQRQAAADEAKRKAAEAEAKYKAEQAEAQKKAAEAEAQKAAEAEAQKAAAAAAQTAAQAKSVETPQAAAEGQRIYVVKKGDTLSGIALEVYGKAGRWREIFEANKDVIKNPNLIRPGWKLRIP